ncbi:autotransporter outer membrane beta-barrel domain-containing protein [Microvirga sp. W0021]|uniref:Autotransporter outer membrane beta-barrel domain-containing protein n=1 Tax=Hohaiivirga grylli TaxID=3133970 RepID=A0ABV0BFL2_9HYPH
MTKFNARQTGLSGQKNIIRSKYASFAFAALVSAGLVLGAQAQTVVNVDTPRPSEDYPEISWNFDYITFLLNNGNTPDVLNIGVANSVNVISESEYGIGHSGFVMNLGVETTGVGQLDMTGGVNSIFSDSITVGVAGKGILNVDAATINVIGGFTVGQEASSVDNVVYLKNGARILGTPNGYGDSIPIVIGASGKGSLIVEGTNLDTRVLARILTLGQNQGGYGYILVDGGRVTSDNTSSTGLTVGEAGEGLIEVVNKGYLSANLARIGGTATGEGSILVTGTGSKAYTAETYIGVEGQGTYTIANGATADTGDTYIGELAGSVGKLIITDSGSELTKAAGSVVVGNYGDGTLSIINGATSTFSQRTSSLTAGNSLGGTGLIEIDGPGSALTANSTTAGGAGEGTLRITNQATVAITNLTVGSSTTGSGTILVSGAGSSLTATSGYIGRNGSGNMTVDSGAVFTSTGTLYAAYSSNSEGHINVRDAGSKFTVDGELYIGYTGSTSSLNIANSATVTSKGGGTAFGRPDAIATINIDGTGSNWINTGRMLFAQQGTATMLISNGGLFDNTGEFNIGGETDAVGKIVVTGSGSVLRQTGVMKLSVTGTGTITLTDNGLLDIQNGSFTMGGYNTSRGTLNIGAPAGEAAAVAGTTNATEITFGRGNNRVVFNHTHYEAARSVLPTGGYEFSTRLTGTGSVDVYAGTTVFTAANDYSGTTTIYGDTLKAGNTDVFSPNSATEIQAAGLLDMAGYNQTLISANNAGWIYTNTSAGLPGVALTVGDYVGSGGNIRLNTYLGTDGSASDTLVVTGSASGNTLLHINNIGGPGEQTYADGILVVDAVGAATTTTDAFALGSRVAAGAYEYSLYRGGSVSTDSWYLRNTLVTPPVTPDPDPEPTPGGEGGEQPGREIGTIPGPNTGGNTIIAQPIYNYRVEVPLMLAVQPVAMEYGYAVLDTLHERVGDHFPVAMEPVTKQYYVKTKMGERILVKVMERNPEREKWFSGAWARVFGDRGFHNNKGQFLKNGSNYNYTFGGIQAGLDVYGRELKDGTVDKAGIYIAYGNIDSRVKGAYYGHAGRIDMDAYSLGAYWTHMSPKGWYTDAVVQGTWYTGDAKSVQGQKIDADGFGFIASLEAGYEFKLDNGYTIEPQAQIIYQHLSFDNTYDAYGRFYFNDAESLRGRIGVRVTKTWNAAEENKPPRLIKAWLRGNIWHEFMGKTKMNVTDVYGYDALPFQTRLGGTWGEIGAGISGQISDTTTLFATASYNRSFEKKGREAWDGRLGMTIRW